MPSPLISGSSTSPRRPAHEKYKDSCDACARSKVKCDKVKPACGRCVTRHTGCQYLQSKRYGKKQDKPRRGRHSKALAQSIQPIQPLQSVQPFRSSETQQQLGTEPGFSAPESSVRPLSGSASPSQTSELDFTDLFSSFGCSDLSSRTTISPSLDDMAFVDPGIIDFDCGPFYDFGPIGTTQPPGDVISTIDGSFSPFAYLNIAPTISADQSTTERFGNPSASRNTVTAGPSQDDTAHQSSDTPTKCNCALPALKQLQNLLLNDIDDMGRGTLVTTISSENNRTIEHMDMILQSSCPHTEHVFSIITMLISEVLDRYRAVVRRVLPAHNTSGSPSAASVPDYETPRDRERPGGCEADEARVAAQLVLGELHGVQRLIKLFPERIETNEMKSGSMDSGISLHNPLLPINSRKREAGPLTNTMLLTMKNSLSDRLRTLAHDILVRLRQD